MHRVASTIEARAGIGLRAPHIRDILDRRPAINWLEVHAENYFGDGIATDHLTRAREHYPISLHGVGLSLGSDQEMDADHLRSWRVLIDRVDPGLISEHMTWSSIGGVYLNDLVELPRSEEALTVITRNVERMQEALKQRILIENPSRYLEYAESEIPEPEFIDRLCRKSGCGLLLDLNNIYINSRNHGFDAWHYVQDLPLHEVGEIHLAGHQMDRIGDKEIWIDAHATPIAAEVWKLYHDTLSLTGPVPTLIEWDSDIPALNTLCAEADKAERILVHNPSDANQDFLSTRT